MRETYIRSPRRTRLVWNYPRIAAMISVGALLAVLGCWAFLIATS